MTISIACDDEHETVEHGRISGSGHRLLSRAALACVALVCAWTGWSHVLRGNEQVVEEVPNPSAQSAPILPSGARSSIAARPSTISMSGSESGFMGPCRLASCC